MNELIGKLNKRYIFSEVNGIIKSRSGVINLSVGDVCLPLPQSIIKAGKRAADELKSKRTFRGYSPESGYDFFKDAIVSYYQGSGVKIRPTEVFISDGIKSDMSAFLNVFGRCDVLLPSPCYPAYVDANVLYGNKISYYHDFPPPQKSDVIVICSPNNPCGNALTQKELKAWVKYARDNKSIILFDAAYEAFVTSDAPRSIYQIEGASECAVEFCSLSKTAGFTGIRCGYTVVPEECGLNDVWKRLKSCLSNGVSYITQRMGECALTTGYEDVKKNIRYYQKSAKVLLEALSGASKSGGVDSPYIWLKVGNSWDEFYRLLDEYKIGVTPGIGFGQCGNEYVRINSFCSTEQASFAAEKLYEYVRRKRETVRAK